MASSVRLHAVRTVLVTGALIVLGGCNFLLDNRAADPNADIFATERVAPPAAAGEAGRNGDASTPTPEGAKTVSEEPAVPPCLVGTKPCGDVCVATSDPHFGCGGPTCERCAATHGAAACVDGACALGTCADGWADCNGLPADGCEVDLASAASCGACGVACLPAPNADASCISGACALACQPGFGDCNGNPADGCETDLLTEKKDCGQCGRVCIIGKCTAGECILKL